MNTVELKISELEAIKMIHVKPERKKTEEQNSRGPMPCGMTASPPAHV